MNDLADRLQFPANYLPSPGILDKKWSNAFIIVNNCNIIPVIKPYFSNELFSDENKNLVQPLKLPNTSIQKTQDGF